MKCNSYGRKQKEKSSQEIKEELIEKFRAKPTWKSPMLLACHDIMQTIITTPRATKDKVVNALNKRWPTVEKIIDDLVKNKTLKLTPRGIKVLRLNFAAQLKKDMDITYPNREIGAPKDYNEPEKDKKVAKRTRKPRKSSKQ